jgi:Uma2 family endonuclease
MPFAVPQCSPWGKLKSMATGALTSAEQYLATHFGEREPEFVRGELVNRSMPTFAHAEAQAILAGLFRQLRKAHPVHGVTEIRVRLKPDLFRIPDVALFAGPRPSEPVPSSPPLVIIEITSPDDRHQDLLEKLEEYRTWGVAHVWVVEPELKSLRVYSVSGLANVSKFELPEFGFHVSAEELFAGTN